MLAFKSNQVILALTTILAAVNLSAAQAYDNPISRPQPGEILTAGSTYNIVWTPNKGDIVGIEIWNSFPIVSSFDQSPCILDDNNTMCSSLVPNMENSGSFSWKIPENAPTSDAYYLDIYVPNPDAGGPYYYMTGNFSIRSSNSASLSSSAIASSSTTRPNREHPREFSDCSSPRKCLPGRSNHQFSSYKWSFHRCHRSDCGSSSRSRSIDQSCLDILLMLQTHKIHSN